MPHAGGQGVSPWSFSVPFSLKEKGTGDEVDVTLGKLYIVATPIGNLEDITLRAIRVLKEVGLVAAEDTRTTRKLLSRFDIHVPLLSYNQHNAAQRLPRLLQALQTTDVALVSDAGSPAISDPGYELVKAARQQGVLVVPIPGPSAVTAALSVAGMPSDSFVFLGFPPGLRRQRQALLRTIAYLPQTLVLFEAPHRLLASLQDMLDVLEDRQIAVCRELTKLHEELFQGRISEALAHFSQPRGEFVLVIAGGEARASVQTSDPDMVLRELTALKAKGLTQRDALAQVTAVHRVSRREAYRLWLELPKL